MKKAKEQCNPQQLSATSERLLSPAAQRALDEAQARRLQEEQAKMTTIPETGGRGGHDPARYGDWEVKGRAIDF